MIIRELLVKLGVKVDSAKLERFSAGLQSAKTKMQSLAKSAKTTGAAVASAASRMALAMAGVVFIMQRIGAAQSDLAETALRLSEAFGITSESALEYLLAFERLGGTPKDLADGFAQVAERAYSAANGGKAVAENFKALGISIDQLKGKKPTELFDLVLKGIRDTKDETKAVAMASTLFGEDLTKKLLPAARSTRENFETLREEIKQSGAVMSGPQIKALVSARLAFKFLGMQVSGFLRQLTSRLAPHVERHIQTISRWIRTNRELIGQRIGDMVQYMANSMEALGEKAKDIRDLVESLGGIKPALQVVISLALTLGSVFAPVHTALILVALVLEDLWVTMQGGDSILNRLGAKFPIVADAIQLLRDAFAVAKHDIGIAMKSMGYDTKSGSGIAAAALSGILTIVSGLIHAFGKAVRVGAAFMSVIREVPGVVEDAVKFVGGAAGAVTSRAIGIDRGVRHTMVRMAARQSFKEADAQIAAYEAKFRTPPALLANQAANTANNSQVSNQDNRSVQTTATITVMSPDPETAGQSIQDAMLQDNLFGVAQISGGAR